VGNPQWRAEVDHWSSVLAAAKDTAVVESQHDRWLTTPRRKEAREPATRFKELSSEEKIGLDYLVENSVKQSQAGYMESRISPDEA
jgi:hypothetical protein